MRTDSVNLHKFLFLLQYYILSCTFLIFIFHVDCDYERVEKRQNILLLHAATDFFLNCEGAGFNDGLQCCLWFCQQFSVGFRHVIFQFFTTVVMKVSRCDNVSGQRSDAIFKDQDVQDILTLEDHTVNRVTLPFIRIIAYHGLLCEMLQKIALYRNTAWHHSMTQM